MASLHFLLWKWGVVIVFNVCVVHIAILLLSLFIQLHSHLLFWKSWNWGTHDQGYIQIEAVQNGFQKMYLKVGCLEVKFQTFNES